MFFKLSEVFIPGGLPERTYNPRSQFDLENLFRDYLESGFKLLSLTGPTKSGKTVLCRKLIRMDQCIWINGGDIREENDFWQEIVNNLELYTDVTTEQSEEVGGEISGNAKTGMSLYVVKGEGELGATLSGKEARGKTLSRTGSPRSVSIGGLKKSMKPVIIDDFHYIPNEVQTHIIRSLKSPIFEGLRVILVSVPHRAYDPDKIESEMTGRVQQLKIPTWEKSELKDIATKGFGDLNVVMDDAIIDALASECFGNPQLMQEFCSIICKINGVTGTLPEPMRLSDVPDRDFFLKITDSIGSRSVFELLARGARQRADRKKRPLITGGEGDIYLAILMALANTGPKIDVQYEELRGELKTVLKGDLPQFKQTSRVLSTMEALSSERKLRILEWDQSTNTLHILDPYFAFFLRWAIRTNWEKDDKRYEKEDIKAIMARIQELLTNLQLQQHDEATITIRHLK